MEASRDHDYVSRLNFGVWFTPVRTVQMVTDIWIQVFDVPLPEVPVMDDEIRHVTIWGIIIPQIVRVICLCGGA